MESVNKNVIVLSLLLLAPLLAVVTVYQPLIAIGISFAIPVSIICFVNRLNVVPTIVIAACAILSCFQIIKLYKLNQSS